MKGEQHGSENVQDEAWRQAWREGTERLQGKGRMAPQQAVRLVRALGLALVGLALLSAVAHGQTAPTAYELRVYAVGAAAPISRTPFPASEVSCNQTPPQSTSTVNPTRAAWDDPANTNRACVWTPSAAPGGVLVSLPIGAYEGTVVAIDAAGESAESNRAPFSRQAVQPARTGLRFTRQAP